MELVFASNNKNKITEIQSMLPESIKILSLEDIGCHEDIPETADTIEGNAILKADYVTQKYGFDCFADDTGLEINALNGEPGVYSARYAGEQKNAEDNINKVLDALKNEQDRSAQFKTVITLNLKGKQFLFTGIIKGSITTTKMGTNGFGYDPVFQPENYSETFAQLPLETKNKIGHRGKAVQQLIDFLNTTK
ncbi:non-canonical purine NTP diphosphatase [Flavobacterium hungaricum]|uniref:dITP/XTP pyrophosphatase n=1 Tax=Flavobacterium hungaricum TaxID=2082725 RepID=A0ABR9TEM2_9FLAO|nr:non-canonical purine NTP diphosphatase [Flavobacterium hungaricum]MBE8723795.1 non-canonical purine NTP diphosphatase [Flavobacterium hungaricum]